MVYSTCSMNPLENEAVVAQAILESRGSVELVPAEIASLKHHVGLKVWKVPDMNEAGTFYKTFDSIPESKNKFPKNRSCSKRGLLRSMFPPIGDDGDKITDSLKHCLRIYPHVQNTGGFFISLRK